MPLFPSVITAFFQFHHHLWKSCVNVAGQALVEAATRWSWSVLVHTGNQASISCAIFAALFWYIATASFPTGKCSGGRSVFANKRIT
jgi:hypothetical protein